MTLPPYAPEATCPKCGHDTANTVYSKGSWYGAVSCSYSCSERSTHREHLERTCQRCHYQWAEACIAPALERAAEGTGG
jgi:hypothetical protein